MSNVIHTTQNCPCDTFTESERRWLDFTKVNHSRVMEELELVSKCRRNKMRGTPKETPWTIHKIIKVVKKHFEDEAKRILTPSEQIFQHFPHLRQVVGFDQFIDKQEHIKFEKADLINDKVTFVRLIFKGRLNAMLVHMKNTCFDWDNWKQFISDTNLSDVILEKGDLRTPFSLEVIKDWADANLEESQVRKVFYF